MLLMLKRVNYKITPTVKVLKISKTFLSSLQDQFLDFLRLRSDRRSLKTFVVLITTSSSAMADRPHELGVSKGGESI